MMGKTDRENRDKMPNHGEQMRQKAMSMAMKRKEEYLGARVPKALKDRVISQADSMNIPVSLLIRRVLEDAFPETTNISGTISGLAENGLVSSSAINTTVATSSLLPVSESNTGDIYSQIIGWKLIEVNQDRSCERCREPLPRGSEASLGFTSTDTGYVIVCHQCKSQLSSA